MTHSSITALRRANPHRLANDAHAIGWLANRSSRSERRLVARGGFEPPKPLGRQIYSLLRLTASLPRRFAFPAFVAEKTSKLRRGTLGAPSCYGCSSRKIVWIFAVATSPAELPEIPCRARSYPPPRFALRRTGGAGEGIRTPDRLITNQLLYRTELRQPRQKSICSTCRATAASAPPARNAATEKTLAITSMYSAV